MRLLAPFLPRLGLRQQRLGRDAAGDVAAGRHVEDAALQELLRVELEGGDRLLARAGPAAVRGGVPGVADGEPGAGEGVVPVSGQGVERREPEGARLAGPDGPQRTAAEAAERPEKTGTELPPVTSVISRLTTFESRPPPGPGLSLTSSCWSVRSPGSVPLFVSRTVPVTERARREPARLEDGLAVLRVGQLKVTGGLREDRLGRLLRRRRTRTRRTRRRPRRSRQAKAAGIRKRPSSPAWGIYRRSGAKMKPIRPGQRVG